MTIEEEFVPALTRREFVGEIQELVNWLEKDIKIEYGYIDSMNEFRRSLQDVDKDDNKIEAVLINSCCKVMIEKDSYMQILADIIEQIKYY